MELVTGYCSGTSDRLFVVEWLVVLERSGIIADWTHG